ncbi:MAG TPA: DUF4382 domain-containing protein [Longimicrobiaceae bacterium]|nr:DUF4382 domain-containing protein [Longimicrobiaceae bacterium]
MSVKRCALFGSLLLGALALGACDGGGTGNGMSRVTIQLTDAPGDLSEAWVDIEQIVLQGDSGQVVLRDQPTGLVNLLTLKNDLLTIVNGVTVPAGSYSQLRFVIGDAYVKTRTGAVYAKSGTTLPAGTTATGNLICPSCSQSGLKVTLPGGSVKLDNDTEILAVDFDVSQSFGHQAGNSGNWVMHPVLHATDFQVASSISGTVTLAQGVTLPATCGGSAVSITQFVPRAIVGADSVGSGAVDANGNYSIKLLPAGTYTMGYASPVTVGTQTLAFTATATPATVTLANGSTATSNYSITAATCQ